MMGLKNLSEENTVSLMYLKKFNFIAEIFAGICKQASRPGEGVLDQERLTHKLSQGYVSSCQGNSILLLYYLICMTTFK